MERVTRVASQREPRHGWKRGGRGSGEVHSGAFLLKGVVSRKKQVIPALMQASQATNTDY